MKSRLRLSQAASLLLALGPLLAGAGGHGWAMIGVFFALYVLAEACLRPNIAPSRGASGPMGRVVSIGLQGISLFGLVLVLFGFGRGVDAVMGLPLVLPYWLPAALSFLALPIFRLCVPPPLPRGPAAARPDLS